MEVVETVADPSSALKGPVVSISNVRSTTAALGTQQSVSSDGDNDDVGSDRAPVQEQSDSEEENVGASPAHCGGLRLVSGNKSESESEGEWEDESLYEEALEGLGDEALHGRKSIYQRSGYTRSHR